VAEYRQEAPSGPGTGDSPGSRAEAPEELGASSHPQGDRSGDPDRLAAAMAAWRAAAAATADPRWARPGSAGCPVDDPVPAGPAPTLADDQVVAAPPATDRAAAGLTPARPGRRRAEALVPALLAALGAVITMVGSAMTWATVRVFGTVQYSVAGMDADQHGRLTAGLGLVVGLAAVVLATGPRRRAARLACALAGAGGVATVLVALLEIGYLRGGGVLAGSGLDADATTVIGPGLWLLVAGGLLGVGAALLARPGRRPLTLPGRTGRGVAVDPYPGDVARD
jgi:hypothetical protein